MSLDAIRSVRRQGFRPGLVWLVIGPVPRWLDDDETVVLIREDSTPEFMDWRAVVGIKLAIFQTRLLPAMTLRAIKAAEAAGARFYGAADATGVYPMVNEPTDEHRRNLQKSWEMLCKS